MNKKTYVSKLRKALTISFLAFVGATNLSNAQTIFDVSKGFNNYDMNGDGIPEIKKMQPYIGTGLENIPPYSRLVTILLEERLVYESYHIDKGPQFYDKLRRYCEDLRLQGYTPNLLTVSLHTGPGQDGRTLLAIREFFKAVKAKWPDFRGAMLVGAFPDAFINQKIVHLADYQGVKSISINPGTDYKNPAVRGLYGERGDIVLGDLDGNWPAVYHQSISTESLNLVVQAFPKEGGSVTVTNTPNINFQREISTFNDIFYLDDAVYTTKVNSGTSITVTLSYKSRNTELAASDKKLANPAARPEISISRINARDVAYNGSVRDPKQEIELIMEYLDRNHNHRSGGNNHLPFRAAAIGHGVIGSNANNHILTLNKASGAFEVGFAQEGASVADLKEWLRKPAILRHVMAHSNAKGSAFSDGSVNSDWHKFWKAAGEFNNSGSHFIIDGGCQVNSPVIDGDPSFMNYGLGQYSSSTLFHLNTLAVLSRAKVYNDYLPGGFVEGFSASESSTFGDGWKNSFTFMGNQSLNNYSAHDFKRSYFWGVQGDWTLKLKYEKGIGILGLGANGLRDEAIVPSNSNITPHWFHESSDKIIGKGDFNGDKIEDIIIEDNVGIGLIRMNEYYETKDIASVFRYQNIGGFQLSGARIQQIGDFNGDKIDDILMVNNTAMAILTVKDKAFTPLRVANNDEWIGGWRYSTANTIHGTGDFDNDGRKDILISSPWGIGIIKYDGANFTTQFAIPNGSWFGFWNYNSIYDVFKGIADINGDKKSDIILTNSLNGLAILTLNSTNTSFTSLSVNKNLENIGTWKLNTQWPDWDVYPDHFATYGDFDGDGGEELVLVNAKQGLGVLTYKNGSLTTLVKANDDSWFGGWRFGVANRIVDAKDMNGDNKAELVITSPWGLGVLNYAQNWFGSLSVTPFGAMLGNWWSESGDEIAAVGKFAAGKVGNKILLKKKSPSAGREEAGEIQPLTSNEEGTGGSQLSIYPMPFTETFKVDAKFLKGEEVSLEITNLEGKLIKSVKSYTLDSEVTLGNEFPKGTYILKVISAKKTEIQKIIKL
ncbi:MAG TPA: T9SS type A sorting domain-containing protein [Cytophagaceae bacterium]|jgi:ribosome modulation factor